MSESAASTMCVETSESIKITPRDMLGKRKHHQKGKAKDGVKTRAKKKWANTAPSNMGNEWTADCDQLPDSEDNDEDAGMADADRPVPRTINDLVNLTMPDLSRYRYAPAIQGQTNRLQLLSISRTAPVLMLSRMSSPLEQRIASPVVSEISPSVLEQTSRSVVEGTSFLLVNQASPPATKGLPFPVTKRSRPKIIIPGRSRINNQQREVSSSSPSHEKPGASSQWMPPMIAEMTRDRADSPQRVDKKQKQKRENRVKNKYGLFVEQEQTSGFECAGQEIISLHPAISVPQEKKSPSAAIKNTANEDRPRRDASLMPSPSTLTLRNENKEPSVPITPRPTTMRELKKSGRIWRVKQLTPLALRGKVLRNLANPEKESTLAEKLMNSTLHKLEPESPTSHRFSACPRALHHFEKSEQLLKIKQPMLNLPKSDSQTILPTIETNGQGTRNHSSGSPKAEINDMNVEEKEVKIKIDFNDPFFIFDTDAPSPTPAPPPRKARMSKIAPKAKVAKPPSYVNPQDPNDPNDPRVRSNKSARASSIRANMRKKRSSETKKKSRASSIALSVLDDKDDRISDFDAAYESSQEPDSMSGSDTEMNEAIDRDSTASEERELHLHQKTGLHLR